MHIPIKAAHTEIEIKKSRFISIACYVESADQAKAEIKGAWEKHPQASHIVYAYQVGKTGDLFGLSDDGEPHGTAGRPVLEVVKGSGITNLLVMVVRYFGGTKLGTGGLVKAYTNSAQAVLAKLPTEELIAKNSFKVQLPYSIYEQARMLLETHSAHIESEDFSTEVILTGTVPQIETESVSAGLRELSAGKVQLEIQEPPVPGV